MTEAQTTLEGADASVTPDTKPRPLDEETTRLISVAINYWHMHGYPEKANVLKECLDQNRTPPANLIYFGDIRPEAPIDPGRLEKLATPPRYGPNGGKDKWVAFAKETTDIEPELLTKMGQRDIVAMLEAKGVIPHEEPKADGRRKVK